MKKGVKAIVVDNKQNTFEVGEEVFCICEKKQMVDDVVCYKFSNGKKKQLLEKHEFKLIKHKKESKDPIVKSVVKQFKKRSKEGISKYGTTLAENEKDDFLQHLKEELMDSILYIEKLQTQKNK